MQPYGANLGKQSSVSNYLDLETNFDLKFLDGVRGTSCRDFKSAALASAT